MKLLIDADGCPVVNECIRAAKQHDLQCWIVCDTAHEFERDGATTLVVPKGADSVDFYLVNKVKVGDIVVTQDYGLAAMALAKGALPINQDGICYTENNIDALLLARYTAKKIRNAGGRLKGPPKRDPEKNTLFYKNLCELIRQAPRDRKADS